LKNKVILIICLLLITSLNNSSLVTSITSKYNEPRKTFHLLDISKKVNLNWTKELELAAIGLPYTVSLPVGNLTFFKYYLYANKTYEIFLYGGFVNANADYDVIVLDSNFAKVKELLNDPGVEEHDSFTPKKTDIYFFEIVNNLYTSESQSYATLVVFEQLDLSTDKNNVELSLNNMVGSNKTYTAPVYNSTYGFVMNVKEIKEYKVTIIADPTSNIAVEVSLYEYTSYLDRIKYSLDSNDEDILIDSSSGKIGETVEISFIVGRRGYEHKNDTSVVLFIKAIRGYGNITLRILLEKTTIEIDILPYLATVGLTIAILVIIAINEEKIRK